MKDRALEELFDFVRSVRDGIATSFLQEDFYEDGFYKGNGELLRYNRFLLRVFADLEYPQILGEEFGVDKKIVEGFKGYMLNVPTKKGNSYEETQTFKFKNMEVTEKHPVTAWMHNGGDYISSISLTKEGMMEDPLRDSGHEYVHCFHVRTNPSNFGTMREFVAHLGAAMIKKNLQKKYQNKVDMQAILRDSNSKDIKTCRKFLVNELTSVCQINDGTVFIGFSLLDKFASHKVGTALAALYSLGEIIISPKEVFRMSSKDFFDLLKKQLSDEELQKGRVDSMKLAEKLGVKILTNRDEIIATLGYDVEKYRKPFDEAIIVWN